MTQTVVCWLLCRCHTLPALVWVPHTAGSCVGATHCWLLCGCHTQLAPVRVPHSWLLCECHTLLAPVQCTGAAEGHQALHMCTVRGQETTVCSVLPTVGGGPSNIDMSLSCHAVQWCTMHIKTCTVHERVCVSTQERTSHGCACPGCAQLPDVAL